MRAFDGDPAVKAALIERLDVAIAEDRFAPDDPAGFDGVLSALAVLIGEMDARRYEAETGTPGALGLLLDHLIRGMADDRPAMRHLARDWLSVVAPGADLAPVPGQLAVLLLDHNVTVEAASRSPAVAEAVKAVAEHHRAALRGQSVTRRQWSTARGAALAATDGADDELAHGAGVLAEALAWDPRTSRSILLDAMGPFATLRAATAVRASGWSNEDRLNADALMQALWDEMAPVREANPNTFFFPPIFEARHPDVSRGFGAALTISNRVHGEVAKQIGEQVLGLMRAAPAHTVETES